MTSDAARTTQSTARWMLPATIGGLVVLLAVAAWLRYDYVHAANLHVDEFTTLWAAQQVREQGAPIMPSGVLYTRGLLYTYALAGLEMLFGAGRSTAFGLSLATGLLTILATWFVGKRAWSQTVGWLAAIGLALLSEAIIWSSRARFYAQLQLFVLLALWAAWESLQVADAESAQNRRTLWLWQLAYAASMIAAIYSQEQAMLLVPTVLLAMGIWRGWRWLVQPPVLAAHIAVLLAMGARLWIEIAGQPGYFETIQSTRPYLGLIFDLAGAWKTYAPLLIGNGYLVWTLAGLLATTAAIGAAVWARSVRQLAQEHRATLYFGLHLAGVLAAIFLLVGTSWRDTRYLFLVQTVWLLLGAAGIAWLLRWTARVLHRPQWHAALAALACLALVYYMTTGWSVLDRQEEGFEQAFAHVKAERSAESAVLSPQPPACAWVLGTPCDGYAIQRGYEEYVIPNAQGTLVDRWTGAPLVNTPEQLAQVIRTHPQTWLVSDGLRLATRYDAPYLRTIIEQFSPVAEAEGALVLRADGWREQPTLDVAAEISPALRFGPLALVGVAHNRDFGGDTPLTVELAWVGAEPIATQINTSVRLVNRAGATVASQDGPPAAGIVPTTLFFDTPLPDRKTILLPADLPAGEYRVEVVAYTLEPEVTALTEPQIVAEGLVVP